MPNLSPQHWQRTSFSTASLPGAPNFTTSHTPRHTPISPYRHSTGVLPVALLPSHKQQTALTYSDHLALLHFEIAIEADPVHSDLTLYGKAKLTQLLTSRYQLSNTFLRQGDARKRTRDTFHLLYFHLRDAGELRRLYNTQTLTITISDGSKESEVTFKIRRDEKIQKSVESYLYKWCLDAQWKRKDMYGEERKLHYCFMFRGVVVGWEETGQHVSCHPLSGFDEIDVRAKANRRQAALKDGDVIDAHLAPDVMGGCLVCGRGHERAREWWSEYYPR